jgi:hypothetical protein
MKILLIALSLIASLFLAGCTQKLPPITLPAGTICAPYLATAGAVVGVPLPTAPTVAGSVTVTGLPTGLSFAPYAISGTPAPTSFGTWPVTASGTYTKGFLTWYWSESSSIFIGKPGIVPPSSPVLYDPNASPPSFTLFVTPDCAPGYTITLTCSDPYINMNGAVSQTTVTTGGSGTSMPCVVSSPGHTTERKFTIVATITSDNGTTVTTNVPGEVK